MKSKRWMLILALCALGAADAFAQSVRPAYSYPPMPSSANGPAYVPLGESAVYASPYVGLGIGHDDNVLYSPNNKRGSTLVAASPGVRLDARRPNGVLQANLQGQAGWYPHSSNDDYFDYQASVQYDHAFSARSFLRLGYSYLHGHDPRGLTDRRASASPDEYRLQTPTATYAYGAPGARGRVELYYTGLEKQYMNNRATTAASDRRQNEYGAAFYVRVAPSTYAVAEARQTEIRFKTASPADGEERRYFGGIMWQATALTSGTLKIGQLRRSFDNGHPDVTATSWEGVVNWAPRTYSTVELRTARQTTEATGLGTFILTSATNVTWSHAWNSVFSTAVLGQYQNDEYQDFNRRDKTKSIGLRVGYRFRRWLTVGAEYNHARRNSNLPQFEYDKNLYLLTATGSL